MAHQLTIKGLHCMACAARIEDALNALPGIEYARIDLPAEKLRFEGSAAFDDTLVSTISTLADSIEPGARVMRPAEKAATADAQDLGDHDEHDHGEGGPSDLLRLGVAAVLFVCALLFDEQLKQILPVPPLAVDAVLYGVPYLLCGTSVLVAGVKRVARGDIFNEFTLMSVATLAAIGIGALSEAVGVMLFYSIGELVQEKAAGKARTSITALLASKPDTAHVLDSDNATPRDVNPESVAIGTLLLVKPGEKIPLDGVVVHGVSRLDTSPLTGESLPVSVEADSQLFAGTINLDGALTLRVTATYKDSSIARILDMVESAMARKAPTERFITRFARVYTPVVTGLAVLVAILPPLLGFGEWSQWFYRALVLLVISCPCALIISVPLGYFGGIGAASRRGILVKGGNVLDGLHDITTIAFDKTGTLTRGVFAVSTIHPVAGISEEELLRAAARVEASSNHPVAKSIMQAAQQLPVLPVLPEQSSAQDTLTIQEVPGKGMVATNAQTTLLAGNAALFAAHNVSLQPEAETSNSNALVYIARDGTYLGFIEVADTLRPETPDAIAALRKAGISRLVMLTGDRLESAKPVAEKLGLDDLRAGLLPQDKATAIEDFGPTKHILFVGDGINDAPVLATAGIGVAMGGLGAQAAIEVADAVILDDSPSRIVDLLRIGKRTRQIVHQNIVLALGVKILFMGFGIVGLSGLWEAVFADVGVALLAVLNATRAGK